MQPVGMLNSWQGHLTEITSELAQTFSPGLRQELIAALVNVKSAVEDEIDLAVEKEFSLKGDSDIELEEFSHTPTREDRRKWRQNVRQAKKDLLAARIELETLRSEREIYSKALEILKVKPEEPSRWNGRLRNRI